MIFILGGNGFVGSGYLRYFLSRGMAFTVIDRSNYKKMVGAECDIFINANGNSKKFIANDDPKSEFLASVVSVRNSLVDFKFKKYIFLSTSDVYTNFSDIKFTKEITDIDIKNQSPYGFHKYMAELCVRHVAKEWLIIRQGGFVGKGIKKNTVFDVLYGENLWVNPSSQFQFINTDDSARLVMELIEKNIFNQVLNLTATGTITVTEIMRLAGRFIPYTHDEKPLCCEISIDKASEYISLPSTYSTVSSFINELKNY